MRWSFSGYGMFRRCPRQWFYKTIFSNSRAKDPLRNEAARLSKLDNIQSWRGKIVDEVISDSIIPSIMWRKPYDLISAEKKADEIFNSQKTQRITSSKEVSSDEIEDGEFFEIEYGIPLNNEVFNKAKSDVHLALHNFYEAKQVWSTLNQAKRLIPQRPLSYKEGEITVQCRPDLILFRSPSSPIIFDWKVNRHPVRDYWLQLVTGAITLTKCTIHKDWPDKEIIHPPHEIELQEVQLLTGNVIHHIISPEDVEDAEDIISSSIVEMQLACNYDDPKQLSPESIPVTKNPNICGFCSYRKLCWRQEL